MADHEHLFAVVQGRDWFECAVPGCGQTTHPRSCYTDDGLLDCSCGLGSLFEQRPA